MTRPTDDTAPDFVKKYVTSEPAFAASRTSYLLAKARALVRRRYHVTFEDIAIRPLRSFDTGC